jgi:NADPH:quinone reductase
MHASEPDTVNSAGQFWWVTILNAAIALKKVYSKHLHQNAYYHMATTIPETMRALQITRVDTSSPTKLIYTILPTPTLKERHVLIRVRASGIQPSDLLNVSGNFPATTFPRIPGRDFSGIVAASNSSAWPVDAEVYATSGPDVAFTLDGAHAEYILVPEELVAAKPKTLSFVEAASVGVPFSTALIALKRAMIQQGETVLVLGATGQVGGAIVQIAKAKGLNVLTGARSDTADVNLKDDTELTAAVSKTNGNGPDVVIDTTGDLGLMKASLKILANGGRLAYIASPRAGSTEMIIDVKDHYRRQHVLIGCNSLLWNAGQVQVLMEELRRLFEDGKLLAAKEDSFEKFQIDQGVEAYEQFKLKKVRKPVIIFE